MSVTVVPSTAAPDLGAYVVPEPSGPLVEGSVDQLNWLVSCIEANGQVVEVISVDPPGFSFISSGVEPVLEHCNQVADANGWFTPSPFDGSETGNRLLYGFWIRIHECLADHGYPTVQPPSEDAFVDQGPELWNPYAGMTGLPLVVRDPATASGAERQQLEAQQVCGASAEQMYAESLQEPGD